MITEQEIVQLASNGAAVQIREERFSDDGVCVGVEAGLDYDGSETTFVLADFGGATLGRIPVRRFLDSRGELLLVDAGMEER